MKTMGNESYKIKVEYGVSTVVLLIGAFFIFQAFTIETSSEAVGPRTMPLSLAIFLVIGGLWLALRAYLGKAGDLKEGYGFLESDIKRIFLVFASGALFVFIFWAFGYVAAIISTYIAMLFTFGAKHKRMILTDCHYRPAFQWVFMGVMMLNDPRGALLDLRPFTNWIIGA